MCAARYPGRAYHRRQQIWPNLTAYHRRAARQHRQRSPRRYEQGRLLGGGSAVNAMVANRGAPADYDEWGALGAEGWTWDDALPYFRKLERDVDFDGPYHGKDGPIPIRRIKTRTMSPFVKALIDALRGAGLSAKARPERRVDRRRLCRRRRGQRPGRARADLGRLSHAARCGSGRTSRSSPSHLRRAADRSRASGPPAR